MVGSSILILKVLFIQQFIVISKIVILTFFITVLGSDCVALCLYLLGSKSIEFHHRAQCLNDYLTAISLAITTTPPYVGPLLNVFCCIYIKQIWWWYIPYVIYSYFDSKPFSGGNKNDWFRHLTFWKYSTDYFPITVKKYDEQAEYKSDRPYLFGYHPHGVLGGGVILGFGSEGCRISKLLPGINIYMGTINILFCCPFLREWILNQGFISVNRSSIAAILSKGPGYGVVIVIGGAEEASLTDPQVCTLILRQRKGFFREGLRYGCRLVPVFGFGENRLYHILPQHSLWPKFSNFIKRYFGFSLPTFRGEGIWQDKAGVIPLKQPLTPVLGKPVDCPKIPNPTDEDIIKIQEEYCNNLKELFENCQAKKIPGSNDLKLVIL